MKKPKIALLIDLASLRVSCEGYKKLAAEIEKEYEIVSVKFYSYVAKRNRDFNEYIAAKGYDAVTPIASRRRNKLDTRQVIDGTLIGMSSSVNAVGIASGEGDILPIVGFLKQKGMDVIDINIAESVYTEQFSGFVKVDMSWLREGYTAPTIKRERKAVKRPAPQPQPEPKKENQYVSDIKKVLSGESILARYKK